MYFNTTNLSGELLAKAKLVTSAQDIQVFAIFAQTPETAYTSHDIEDLLVKYPRSPIVRSINTLTNKGLLKKTNDQVIGKFGKLVYTWKLNYISREQVSLFENE